MKRLAAVVAAVAMVAGALWVRGRMDGGGDGGDDAGPPGATPVLVCATELEDACAALADGGDVDVSVELAGDTVDRLAAGEELGADGWLVPQPWPEMATIGAAPGAAPELEVGDVLARSPAVLVVRTERVARLGTGCQWACLGEAAGEPWADHGGESTWGQVEVVHGSPEGAAGLIVLAGAVAGFLGDPGYATNDLTTDEATGWLTGLERAVGEVRIVGDPVADMLTRGPAGVDAVGALEASAGPIVARSARRDEVDVLYPSPMVTADVVLATVPGADGAEALDELLRGDDAAAALAGAGWRVEGHTPATGVGTGELPPQNGLPGAGVLVALRDQAAAAR